MKLFHDRPALLGHASISTTEFMAIEAVTHKIQNTPNTKTRKRELKLHAAKSGIYFQKEKHIL